MPDIVLATLNARYAHASLGLRYLFANMGDLQSSTTLAEFEIRQPPADVARQVLALSPRIIGFGVYIWNTTQSATVIRLLREQRPDLVIVLGGPEVSYEQECQAISALADHIISGEGDLAFATLCRSLLNPAGSRPPKFISAPLPDLATLTLPYYHYSSEDIAHRVLYVEASRGCPFTCEFCLSSLDIPVRQFPLEPFLAGLDTLIQRGAKQFKFVDRTFNLNPDSSRRILDFFLSRMDRGLFLHFEMVPDRLPLPLRDLIRHFPAGTLQFEIGIQTFNAESARLIRRKQDVAKLADNFRFLREETGVHIHADLIVGLPGEDVASFAAGLDHLVALRPQEIQIGILKKLRGTPIGRHDADWGMVYSTEPPYEILENRLIDRATLDGMKRFARFWDLIVNSGSFVETAPLIWRDATPFEAFLRLADGLFAKFGRQHGIPLDQLAEALFEHLVERNTHPREELAGSIWNDYQQAGRLDMPLFLRPFLPTGERASTPRNRSISLKRQARHSTGGPHQHSAS